MHPPAETLFHQATERLAQGDAAGAAPLYEEGLRLCPDDAEAWSNLGVAHAELGRHDAAIRCYDSALRILLHYPEALYNRGNSFRTLKRFEAALTDYDAALRLNSEFPQAWVNRGLVLMRLGRAAEAVASYRQALALRPQYPEALNNLGLALQVLGYTEDALDHFNAALALRPDYGPARSNRGQVWLLKGDFARGWPEYEWRWTVVAPPPTRELPLWDGSPRPNQSILLRHEQGLGDTIQFIRYAPMVKERVGRVVLECPARLHPLLRGVAGLDALTTRDDPAPHCDLQRSLLSLPSLFQTDFRSIPATIPYLTAEPERIERWRDRLPPARRRIGVAWQGNPDYPEDAYRSIPLAAFAPLADVPDVTLISLQRNQGVEQLTEFRAAQPIHVLPENLDPDGAFLDTAAVMMHLDLVITSDTSIAHLAGALGRPTWLALSVGSEWRWLRDRDDSPWYPHTRLFRQRTPHGWPDVFRRIADALAP